VEQARKLAEERAEEMRIGFPSSPRQIQRDAEALESGRKPLLATGDEADEAEERAMLGILYGSPPREDTEEEVLQYAAIHNGNVDISDASSILKMPSDEVEQALLKLLSEGKVKMTQQEKEGERGEAAEN
jgi:hypothetical protein